VLCARARAGGHEDVCALLLEHGARVDCEHVRACACMCVHARACACGCMCARRCAAPLRLCACMYSLMQAPLLVRGCVRGCGWGCVV